MASAEQDQWSEVCDAVRAQLAKRVELMPAMTMEEAAVFVGTIDTAMWNDVRAQTHDATVEERRKTLEREGMFGG